MIKFYNLFFSGCKPFGFMFLLVFIVAYFGWGGEIFNNAISVLIGMLLFNVLSDIFSRLEPSINNNFYYKSDVHNNSNFDPDADNLEVDIIYDVDRPGTSI